MQKIYRYYFILIFGLLYPPLLIGDDLPDLGNSGSSVLSSTQEIELGRSIMKKVQSSLPLANDSIVNDYLQNLGYRLIATYGRPRLPFRFFAIEDRSINAFALPGGFIGVNTGLILATESESELAGVLSHEIAHVQQKHIARMIEHMGRLKLSTIAGVIAAILISTQNPQAGSGALATAMAGSQQALINYTREHEKEADYIGIQALVSAGFDPMGMPAFFHRMSQDTRYYGNYLPEYLMTHPMTETRLFTSKDRALQYPYKQVPDSLLYHFIQARVQTMHFSTAEDAVTYFYHKLRTGHYRDRRGTLYGYALALIGANKAEMAKPSLEELLKIYPDHYLLQLAYSQIEFQLKQEKEALLRLENALQNHPKNYALTYALGEGFIKVKENEKAIRLLKSQIPYHYNHPELLALLSHAYSQNRQFLQAHLMQAQYFKQKDDLTNAEIQIKLAKKLAQTPQEKNQIESFWQEFLRK